MVSRKQREVMVMFYTPRKGKSSWGSRISLPIPWMKDMGISPESRNVLISYDEENKCVMLRKR